MEVVITAAVAGAVVTSPAPTVMGIAKGVTQDIHLLDALASTPNPYVVNGAQSRGNAPRVNQKKSNKGNPTLKISTICVAGNLLVSVAASATGIIPVVDLDFTRSALWKYQAVDLKQQAAIQNGEKL
ncbi:hypothetical protein [Pseudomonas sp. AL03]|uniref:hypothetical protein n=1 Tax=Pseudomonas sp. AL03 TaxID=3042230 RepID=UPI00249A25C4|nr:hypothetical protein [Pseudomonas sp. AL03]MDI3275653.1 hypothetical protein [Pseudomonas sp. AL03]